MDSITQILFKVSNSLLIPNILILLILFVRSLILVGAFYNSFMRKRRTDALLRDVHTLRGRDVISISERLPQTNQPLVVRYLVDLLSRESLDEDYVAYRLSLFEGEAERDLATSRMLAKVGPVLGLIGTLISMSPALVGLSSGDIEGMAYNMQIVFATTVVGLVISLVGLVTQQYKQRWYAKDLAALEYVSAQLLVRHEAK